jgi:DNA end-binding protein Ku
MARSIWTGAVGFGLVTVPVGVYSATEDKTIEFHQFERGTSDRVRYERVNERTGEEVDYEDIVKGHDVGGGDYVIVTPEELEAVEPGPSRTIDITDFVELEDIDPLYFHKAYYLGPKGEEARRPYDLLRQAMAASGRVAIADFVMREKQYLVAIRATDRVLVMETLFFADEVRDPADTVDDLPRAHKFAPRDLSTAKQLIESLSTTWDPTNYRDTYRDRVSDLVRRKQKGQEVVQNETGEREGAEIVDLMQALQASVEAAKGKHRPGNRATRKASYTSAAKKSAAKKSTAKKSTAKKSTAKKSTAKKSTAKKSAAKKSAAKKSAAKKSTAKKSTAKKTAARRRAS